MQCLNILQNVGGFVGDEQNVEVFERLVDIADIRCLDGGVLTICGDQLWERRQ